MTRVVDFNAFRAEHEGEPVDLKIGGDTYHLASSMPAAVAVDAIALKAKMDDNEEVPLEVLDKMGRSVFGDDVWGSLLAKHRIQIDEVGDLIQMVLKLYAGGSDDADPFEGQTPPTPESSST